MSNVSIKSTIELRKKQRKLLNLNKKQKQLQNQLTEVHLKALETKSIKKT